jgi:hypothetical protein
MVSLCALSVLAESVADEQRACAGGRLLGLRQLLSYLTEPRHLLS